MLQPHARKAGKHLFHSRSGSLHYSVEPVDMVNFRTGQSDGAFHFVVGPDGTVL